MVGPLPPMTPPPTVPVVAQLSSAAGMGALRPAPWRVTRADELPALQPSALAPLLEASRREGWHFVERLLDACALGREPGALGFLAWQGDAIVGVLVLGADPQARASQAARVRRIYVAPAQRGGGVGQALLRAAIAAATGRHEHLLVQAEQPGLVRLVERMGFRPATEEPEATHRLVLPFR